MQTLQQAITDHEPEFVSLQRELVNISQGPTIEPAFYDRLSKDLQSSSSGKDKPRPGQQTQEETLKDYQERLDALKRSLVSTAEGLASKLEQSAQFKGDMAGLLDWMNDVVGRIDELVIRDPKSVPIEEQCSKCKVCSCRLPFLYIECTCMQHVFSVAIVHVHAHLNHAIGPQF